MKCHPFCEAFPLIEGAEFDELVADIKQHGLREPILTFGGLILDGRNRARACQIANIPLRSTPFVGTEEQARALVVSANVHRRHLTASQRALAFAELAKWMQTGRPIKGAPGAPFQAKVPEIAEEAHVSDRTMQQAKAVAEKGSKGLKESVRAGDISIKKAAAVLDLPQAEQLAAAQAPPPSELADCMGTDERQRIEREDREYRARIERVMNADDTLGAAHGEIQRLTAELVAAYQARDRYMNEAAALRKQVEKLERQMKRLRSAHEAATERVAIMSEGPP